MKFYWVWFRLGCSLLNVVLLVFASKASLSREDDAKSKRGILLQKQYSLWGRLVDTAPFSHLKAKKKPINPYRNW